MNERRRSGPGRHLRQRFLTGRVLLLPQFITVRRIGVVFNLVSGTIVGPPLWVRFAVASPAAGPALS